jgi:hypothetical protein
LIGCRRAAEGLIEEKNENRTSYFSDLSGFAACAKNRLYFAYWAKDRNSQVDLRRHRYECTKNPSEFMAIPYVYSGAKKRSLIADITLSLWVADWRGCSWKQFVLYLHCASDCHRPVRKRYLRWMMMSCFLI